MPSSVPAKVLLQAGFTRVERSSFDPVGKRDGAGLPLAGALVRMTSAAAQCENIVRRADVERSVGNTSY